MCSVFQAIVALWQSTRKIWKTALQEKYMEVHKRHEVHVFDLRLTPQEIEALGERKMITESYFIENKIYQFRMRVAHGEVVSISDEQENEL